MARLEREVAALEKQRASTLGLIIAGIVALGAGLFALGKYLSSTGDDTEALAEQQERYNKAMKGTLEVSAETQSRIDSMVAGMAAMSRESQIAYLQTMRAVNAAAGMLENVSALTVKLQQVETAAVQEGASKRQQARDNEARAWKDQADRVSAEVLKLSHEYGKKAVELLNEEEAEKLAEVEKYADRNRTTAVEG